MSESETRGIAEELIELEDRWGARNYRPLDVVVERAAGAWVYDVEGRRYLDCLSAYSALNQGHCHPRIVGALREQAARVTLTSRAFRNEQLPRFAAELARLCGMEMVLPMNTGAEAVETAIKAARRWGYTRKGIPREQAEIIVCENNFHGRSTTIISFSSEAQYRNGFGPFTPGFVTVPFGDAAVLEEAVTPNTCAFLFEPIQCEAGILIPPDGYLRDVAEICRRERVLLAADEIQTGLGRTGYMFACEHEDVQPDLYIPGRHGSTFGGNPLACAAALAALKVIEDERLADRSAELGGHLLYELRKIRHPHIKEIRGRGLLIGIELLVPARPYCERLAELGLLCKETHDAVIRLAPPLVISPEDLDWAIGRLRQVFDSCTPL